MNKTHEPFLTSWPVPVDFREVISFKSFKDCFKFRIRDGTTSKKMGKSDSLKAMFAS